MSNVFDDMTAALKRACDHNASAMVDLLEGNLRGVDPRKLQRLKRELQEFNSKTGRWK